MGYAHVVAQPGEALPQGLILAEQPVWSLHLVSLIRLWKAKVLPLIISPEIGVVLPHSAKHYKNL